MLDQILKSYFHAHRELIAAEEVDDSDVVVSFPFHYTGNHRVEVSVTKGLGGEYLLSDMGRTIGELKESGYAVALPLRTRLIEIAKPANVRIVEDHLIMDCKPEEIGNVLHTFAEAAKTIGDAYLAYRVKVPQEQKLLSNVRQVFAERQIAYRPDHKVAGSLDTHTVNVYIPPNGKPGLALEVLAGYNTHALAQIWGFKCGDIRAKQSRLKLGLVYDVDDFQWSEKSENILRSIADFAIPSSQLTTLGDAVESAVLE